MSYAGKLVLASGSRRRRELLASAGYQFDVIPPDIDEDSDAKEQTDPKALVARLAERKSGSVAKRLRQQGASTDVIVIGCDTVAYSNGQILGKPRDRQHALEMLRLLAGSEHFVFSGLCLWPVAGLEAETRVAQTTLRMDLLSDAQRTEYLDSNLWQGKAGAFGYQDRLGWVHVVSGSPSNVVGLPMELLTEMLAKFD